MIFKIKIDETEEKVFELLSYQKFKDNDYLLNMPGDIQYELDQYEFLDEHNNSFDYIEATILTNSLVMLEKITWTPTFDDFPTCY